MSVIAKRADDPRIRRSRAAVVEAARTLFMRKGYAGTTMEEIATAAGLTKRTLYNNYADKDALFTVIVKEFIDYAEAFARALPQEFAIIVTPATLEATLHDLGQRLALGIMRPEVIALRRLLIGEAREFPALGAQYFERAPGQVLEALSTGFAHLAQVGLLQLSDARAAAAQFAYLIVGEPLDRAMLVGAAPTKAHVIATARAGVETFLARYGKNGKNGRNEKSENSEKGEMSAKKGKKDKKDKKGKEGKEGKEGKTEKSEKKRGKIPA